MTLREASSATVVIDKGITYKVISVSKYKTSLLGPADLPQSTLEFEALQGVVKFVSKEISTAKNPFVVIGLQGDFQGGSPYTSSRLAYELNKAWASMGMKSKYGPYCSSA